MGLYAALFSSNNRMCEYDREYDLRPPDFSGYVAEKWEKLAKEGMSKRDLISYLQDSILLYRVVAKEALMRNREDSIDIMQEVLRWVNSLPNDCKIISRNDVDDWDEYYELAKKCEGRELNDS